MLKKKGFTLIELLVVIAIIGILASVVLASLNTAREKGNQASVKSNLKTIQAQAELYYDDNNMHYAATDDLTLVFNADCPDSTGAEDTMFEMDTTISKAILAAESAGNDDAQCYMPVNAQSWSIFVGFKDESGSWCIDSTGYAGSSTDADNDGVCD